MYIHQLGCGKTPRGQSMVLGYLAVSYVVCTFIHMQSDELQATFLSPADPDSPACSASKQNTCGMNLQGAPVSA
jgi:hypothetical protein